MAGFTRVNVASGFIGINQAAADRLMRRGESKDALNAKVSGGTLSVAPGCSKFIDLAVPQSPFTPMLFAHYYPDGTIRRKLLVSTSSGIYEYEPAPSSRWTKISGDNPVTSTDFSFVNYREDAVSKIFMSNGADSLYWYDGTTFGKIDDAPKGTCLAVHVQRMWIGGVKSAPNMFYWSDDGHPSNWELAPDKAGYFGLQEWSGGRVVAIFSLLGDITVFQENCIFRVVGTYPDEFQAMQVLTVEGTIAPRSVCQYGNRAYFLSDDGIMAYDTSKAYQLAPGQLREFWSGVNKSALSGACGAAHNGKLYMAVPYGATQTTNNRVIEYDIAEKTFAIRDLAVARFLADNESLLFTGADDYIYQYGVGGGAPVTMEWCTPDTDLGIPDRKFAYDVYVSGKTDDEDGKVKLELYTDGTKASETTLALPKDRVAPVRGRLQGNGRTMYVRLSNVDGASVHIESVDLEVDVLEDV